MKRHVGWLSAVAVVLAFATQGGAQDKTKTSLSPAEEKARLARRGAGLIVGSWSLVDDPASGTTTTEDSPVFVEGYFRKGLDKHIALETTFGVWRRQITDPGTGGPFGTAGGKTTVILLPQMTSIKLFPFTTPDNKIEPYISGGAGFTIGVVSESGSGGLVGGSGGVTGLTAGVGGRLMAGVEWRLGDAFGLTAGGHYTYIQFFDKLGGEEMYRGTGITVGMTYRFQY
jgi:hypothetical protein